MMIALFILSLAVFGYLVYVLLKPEKFSFQRGFLGWEGAEGRSKMSC